MRFPGDVQEVNIQPLNLRLELWVLVQFALSLSPIKGVQPVVLQGSKGGYGCTIVPAGLVILWLSLIHI